MSDVTRILSMIESGDRKASEELLPLVYDELCKLAAARMASERPDHMLQATALVESAGSEKSQERGGERERVDLEDEIEQRVAAGAQQLLELSDSLDRLAEDDADAAEVLALETDARDLVIGPRTGLVEPFDGIAELWVESEEAPSRDWSNEKAKESVHIVYEDEQNLIDSSRSTIPVSNENIVIS